uniref:Uncharacterized protein n=1 Tax=Aegilops tauschii subsp. strangulata TaxID=200361 RepID=A0A453T8D4_AEGTS
MPGLSGVARSQVQSCAACTDSPFLFCFDLFSRSVRRTKRSRGMARHKWIVGR